MYPQGVFAEDFYGPSPDVTGYGADPPPANTAAPGPSVASFSVNAAAPVVALAALVVLTFVLYHVPTGK